MEVGLHGNNLFIILNTHKLIFKNINYKLLVFLLIIIAGALEFFGLSLLYPLVSILFEIETQNNQLLDYLNNFLNLININSKFLIILLICLLVIFKAIFLFLYRYICTINVINFQLFLQKELFSKYYLTIFSYSENKKSRLINSISEQAKHAQSAMQIQFNILENIIILIFLIVLSYFISLQILILSIVLSFFIMLIFKFTISLANKYSLNLISANELFYKLINKSLTNFKYIKVTNTNEKFFNEFKPIIGNIKINTLKFVLLNRGSKIMIEPIVLILVSIIFFISIKYLAIDISLVLIMYLIIARVFQKFLALINLMQQYSKDNASVSYCFKFLDELNNNREKGGNIIFKKFNSITLKDISFSYGSNQILKNLNLDIKKNKITTIYGKSGIGKTTLSNLLMLLIYEDSGQILLNKKKMRDYDYDKLRAKIGYVSQDNSVFNMSLIDNLCLRNKKTNHKEIIKYLKKFDLNQFLTSDNKIKNIDINQDASNLSNGQKQRISIIRELLAKPEILILDEITSSVDKDSLFKIMDTLKSLKSQTTIFIITHQIEYRKISDYNYLLENKKLKKII